MKKLNKIALSFLLTGFLICIIFGIIAFNQIADFFGKDEFSELITSNYEADQISTININIINRYIQVMPSQSDEVIISYHEYKRSTMSTSQSNDGKSIYFKETSLKGFSFWAFAGIFNREINALSIAIPEGFSYNLILKTINGSIIIKAINALMIEGETSNGKLSLEDINCEKINLSSSNGNIQANNINAIDTIKLQSSNGKINLSNLTSKDIMAITSNGNIIALLEKPRDDYYLTMKTSNGHYYIDGKKATSREHGTLTNPIRVDLNTSNGSIKITFEN